MPHTLIPEQLKDNLLAHLRRNQMIAGSLVLVFAAWFGAQHLLLGNAVPATVFLACCLPFGVFLYRLIRQKKVEDQLEWSLFVAIAAVCIVTGINNGLLAVKPNYWPLLAFIPLATITLHPKKATLLVGLLIATLVVFHLFSGLGWAVKPYSLQPFSGSKLLSPGFTAMLASLLFFGFDLSFRNHARQYRKDIHVRSLAARDSEARFLASVSQAIRDPLNGVIGALDTITSDRDLASIHTNANLALRVGNQLTHIINDVLDIKRVDEGEISIACETFDVHQVLRAIYAINFAQIGDKPVSLVQDTTISELPRFVKGDEARITQILLNITSNAIKFTAEGKVNIDVHYRDVDSMLEVKVSDTGIGMAPEVLAQIFSRHKRVADDALGNTQNLGLGMVLTKALVELMDGKIEVQSQLGQGTTVNLQIPLAIDMERQEKYFAGEFDELAASRAAPSLKEMRILCVDDSRLNLQVTKFPLQRAGARVSTCESAVEALEMLHAYQYDLLITDISMPIMSGEELLSTLRQFVPGLPVIALTAYTMPGDLRRYRNLGFDGVLGKPVTPKALLQTVAKFHPEARDDSRNVGR